MPGRYLVTALLGTTLAACGVGGMASSPVAPAAGEVAETFEGPVPKATCQPGDRAEDGLQGQVPPEDRASGVSATTAYNCNLTLLSQFTADSTGGNSADPMLGDGAGWAHAWFNDCSYYGTGAVISSNDAPKPGQANRGVVVVDGSDSTKPVATAFLSSPSMIDPWESLKVHARRGLLAALDSTGGGSNGAGGTEIDLYDIAGDCKHPRLLVSRPLGTVKGHAGHFTPDGLTYYNGTNGNGTPKAIDVSDPADPQLITENFAAPSHDLSFNDAGTRGYFTSASPLRGMIIVDVSEIQQRKPDPQTSVVSSVEWTDGGIAQMTQPITIKGKPYILHVDEGAAAAATGNGPIGAARLIDISDETHPFIASKLKLEAQMPENLNSTREAADGSTFGYQGHYCTASDGVTDNSAYTINDAAIAICSYFQSGLRVFDIRNPYKPREIAYYNPPARTGYHAGSYYNLTGDCGTADWATAHARYRPERNEIWFTSQCNGLQVVKFEQPLAELLGPSVQ